jgi:hypothetical protein
MTLILLLLLSLNVQAQNYPTIDEELDKIESIIKEVETEEDDLDSLEKDTINENNAEELADNDNLDSLEQDIAEEEYEEVAGGEIQDVEPEDRYIEKKPEKRVLTESNKVEPNRVRRINSKWGAFGVDSLKVEVDDPSDMSGVYHYGYLVEEEDKSGEPGRFVVSFMGEAASFDSSKSKAGLSIELGYQIPFRLIQFLAATTFGFRKDPVSESTNYPIGLKAALRLRVLSWLYPFGEAGVEFIKISDAGSFKYPFTMFGGGLMFRLGKLDKKAEFSSYRNWGLSRTLLIFSYNMLKSPDTIVQADANLIRFGISIEL